MVVIFVFCIVFRFAQIHKIFWSKVDRHKIYCRRISISFLCFSLSPSLSLLSSLFLSFSVPKDGSEGKEKLVNTKSQIKLFINLCNKVILFTNSKAILLYAVSCMCMPVFRMYLYMLMASDTFKWTLRKCREKRVRNEEGFEKKSKCCSVEVCQCVVL